MPKTGMKTLTVKHHISLASPAASGACTSVQIPRFAASYWQEERSDQANFQAVGITLDHDAFAPPKNTIHTLKASKASRSVSEYHHAASIDDS